MLQPPPTLTLPLKGGGDSKSRPKYSPSPLKGEGGEGVELQDAIIKNETRI